MKDEKEGRELRYSPSRMKTHATDPSLPLAFWLIRHNDPYNPDDKLVPAVTRLTPLSSPCMLIFTTRRALR